MRLRLVPFPFPFVGRACKVRPVAGFLYFVFVLFMPGTHPNPCVAEDGNTLSRLECDKFVLILSKDCQNFVIRRVVDNQTHCHDAREQGTTVESERDLNEAGFASELQSRAYAEQ